MAGIIENLLKPGKTSLSRHAIMLFVILCMSFSDAGWAIGGADAQKAHEAFIRESLEEIRRLQNKNYSNPKKHLDETKSTFLKYFDFGVLAPAVLGRHWGRLSSDQQQRFEDALLNYINKSYGERLLQADWRVPTDLSFKHFKFDQEFKFTKNQKSFKFIDDREIKITRVWTLYTWSSGQTPPVRGIWEISSKAGRLKLVNLIFDGVSLVRTHRDEFHSFLKRSDIEQLITRLEEIARR